MNADLFLINSRLEEQTFLPAGLSDFGLTASGQITVDALIASPDWTLYALDLEQRKAMLVEMPAGSDLSDATFVYIDQQENGRRVAILSLDDFVAASLAIAPPANLSFLFSTGRCGSTLASRFFAQLPETWSLSEPDYLTSIAMACLKHERAELVSLVRAATLWICRPPKARAPGSIIIKTRSEATMIAELCHEAFPQSRDVFMYCDLLGWLNSIR